jgi:hypothetical protein
MDGLYPVTIVSSTSHLLAVLEDSTGARDAIIVNLN